MRRFAFAAFAAASAWLGLGASLDGLGMRALAQSSPCFNPGTGCRSLQTGDVPTAPQWNSFFTGKSDYPLSAGEAAANLGFTPLAPANNLSDVSSPVTAFRNLGFPVFPVDAYGAKGDYQTWGDGVTNGTTAFTSTSATFSPADCHSGAGCTGPVDKRIFVFYGGTAAPVAAPATPSVFTPGSSSSIQMTDGTASCYPRNGSGSANYYYRITYVGSGGETTGSTENGAALACASAVLQITTPTPKYGAIAYNVYASTSAGTETLQNDYPLKIGQTWIQPTTGLRSGGASVPGANTTSATPMLDTTIVNYVSAHSITLGTSAGSSLTALNFGYATDDSAAFNSALSACGSSASLSGVSHGGGRVLMGLKQYLVYASGINFSNACDLGYPQLLSSQQVHSGTPPAQLQVPAIVLAPAQSVNFNYGDAVDGIAIFQWGLPSVNMTTRTAVDAMSSYAGTALAIANDEGAQVSHVLVVGFEYALLNNQAQRTQIDHFWWDSINGIFVTHSHDPVIAEALEGWTFYQSNASWAEQNWTTTSVGNDGSGHVAVIAYDPVGALRTNDLVRIESVNGYLGANNVWRVASTAENATATATQAFTSGVTTSFTVASCPSVTAGWPVYDVTKGKAVGTVSTCTAGTLTLQAAAASSGSNGDALSFGSTTVLADSQNAPSTACTWALGAMTMTCNSLNSLSIGQTTTMNSAGNTVDAIDYQTNTVLLANKTVGTGSATTLTFANPAFVNDGKGSINLSTAYRGGKCIYAADSQGFRFVGASCFGYAVGWQGDQVSTSDKLGQLTLTDMTCDSHQEPSTICGLVTEQSSAVHHGSIKWANGSVSIGPGQPLVADGGSSQTAAVFVSNLHVSEGETTGMIGSAIGGNLEITGGQLTPGSGAAAQGLFNVGSSVSEVHLAGVQWSAGYLGFANPGQGNVWFSGDTSINAASPGAHILQLYSGAGTTTWTRPGGLSFADVAGCGGAGSGGSGAALTSGTASSGGAGGGGGGCFGVPSAVRFAAADLGTSQTVTVGAGGASVAGVTGGSASATQSFTTSSPSFTISACPSSIAVGSPIYDTTSSHAIGTLASCFAGTLTLQAVSSFNSSGSADALLFGNLGASGNPGGLTTFGSLLCGVGGGGGSGGLNGANGGGGAGAGFIYNATNCGNTGSVGTSSGGNSTLQNLGVNLPAQQGSGGAAAGGGNASSSPGSGGGGAGNNGAGTQGRTGGAALYGCGGGGSGAGLAATPAALNSGTGGLSLMSGSTPAAATGGAGGSGSSPILAYVPGNGAAGGGSMASGTGNAGGAGIQCGGGGGGGSTISTGTSGASGAGGPGFVALWQTF